MIVTRLNLRDAMKHLAYVGEWGLDTETTGLKWRDRAFSLILSNPDVTMYFNFQEYPGLDPIFVLPKEEILKGIETFVLANPLNIIYKHNAKFDWHMLWKEGFDVKAKVVCTYAIERVLKNNYFGKGAYGLDLCAMRRGLKKDDKVSEYITKHKLYTDVDVFGKKEPIREKHFDRVPFEIIAPYGEKDGSLVLALGKSQRLKIADIDANRGDAPPILPVVENEIRLTRTLAKMERHGVLLDVELIEKAIQYEAEKIREYHAKFEDLTGKTYEDSRVLFREVFDRAGEKYPLTDKGNPSFAGDVLELMDSPIAGVINRIRYHEKRLGTYYSSYLYYKDDDDDVLHANALQGGTTTGRMSYTNPNCVSMDTEVLTPQGWVNGYTYVKGTPIAVYSNKKLHWEIPSKVYVSGGTLKKIITAKKDHFNMRMTDDHRVHYVDRKSKKELVRPASRFPIDAHILHGAVLEGTLDVPAELLKLIVAVQADGSYSQGNQIVFVFKKERKIARLKSILLKLGVKWTEAIQSKGQTRISIPLFTHELLIEKMFTFKVLSLTRECREVFVRELRWWDGSSTRDNFDYCSIHKQNIDVVQAVASTLGYRCHVYKHSSTTSDAYVASFTFRSYTGTANVELNEEISTEKVWCVEVSSGFFLARRGDTFITGNCQNISKEDEPEDQDLPYHLRECFIPRPGHFFYDIDYEQMEYKLMLDYAGELPLIKRILEGEDLHQATADMVGITRKQAKTLNFGLLYGAGHEKIALMLKVKEWEALQLMTQYFARLPKVERFIDLVKHKAKSRKYIYNWFGRRSYFATAGETYKAPNHLIQGGCADIVKVAMNKIDDYLDQYKTKMLLQVHDELLFEVPFGEEWIGPRLQEIMEGVYKPMNGLSMSTSIAHSTKSWGYRHLKKGLYVHS